MCRPNTVSLLNEVEDFIFRLYKLLFESLDLHLVVLVFEKFELLMVVDEIVDLASIDFVHGYGHSEVAVVLLEIVDASVKQILDC